MMVLVATQWCGRRVDAQCKKHCDAVKKEKHKKKPVFSSWARSGRRTFGPQPPSENNLHAAQTSLSPLFVFSVSLLQSSSSSSSSTANVFGTYTLNSVLGDLGPGLVEEKNK